MKVPQIACPKCDTKYPFDAALAGRKVKCASCGHMFYLPAKARSEPVAPSSSSQPVSSGPPPYVESPSSSPPPIDPLVQPPFIASHVADKVDDERLRSRSKKLSGFRDFVWQLLDFRIEKYLTPYIVRFYWVLALVVVVLYLVKFILTLLLEGPAETFDEPVGNQAIRELLGQPREYTSEYSSILVWYSKFVRIANRLIASICLVLMVRVWCEILVVAFNMANSLKSIEQKIDVLDRKNQQ